MDIEHSSPFSNEIEDKTSNSSYTNDNSNSNENVNIFSNSYSSSIGNNYQTSSNINNIHEDENIFSNDNHKYPINDRDVSTSGLNPDSRGSNTTTDLNSTNNDQEEHSSLNKNNLKTNTQSNYKNNNNSNNSNNSQRKEKGKYKLIVKIIGTERAGKKDLIFRFDAYTNLPQFRTTTFRDVRRSHHEFEKLFSHLNGANPECIVPAVPPAYTSAGAGTEEDEIRVRANMQEWIDKITNDSILSLDREIVYFIESDFGYSPMKKSKPPATGLRRKAIKQFSPPQDSCIELCEFRPLVKSFYLLAEEAQIALEKRTKALIILGVNTNDFGSKLGSMAELEDSENLSNMWRKLGKTVMTVGDLLGVNATGQMFALGDGLLLLSRDAYVAKEVLTNRQLLMRDLNRAQSNTKAKHQTASRVRGSINISSAKVDEAINALEEANNVEASLTEKVDKVTKNLLHEKEKYLQNTESELKRFISDYVQRIVDAERKTLSVWEGIRLDVRSATQTGGLSRLGRPYYPKERSKNSGISSSQGPDGDSWSGDRKTRSHGSSFTNSGISNNELPIDQEDLEEPLGLHKITEIDARNAAYMLAGSTF